MTDNDDSINKHDGGSPDERLVAILGLLADQVSPIGPAPTLLEIQDWQSGKLDDKRAAEVKSHIARDPACYQMWSDLLAEEKQSATMTEHQQSYFSKTFNKIRNWWTTPVQVWASGGLVTAMVIIMVFVFEPGQKGWSPADDPIVANLDYDWPYAAISATRGGELNYRQKIALQTGIRTGLEITTQGKSGWSIATNSLPSEALPCESEANNDDCIRQTKTVQKIGLHAGVLYMACLEYAKGKQMYFDASFWKKQTKAWNTMSADPQFENIPSLKEKIQILGTSRDKKQQCEYVRDVIYMSY